jgi:hypothetical protein
MKVLVVKGGMKGTVIEATEHILTPLLERGIAEPYAEKEEKAETETKELKEPRTRGRKTHK